MASPIQIVLNPENFEEAREAGGGGGRKDFFANRDREFGAHKAALMRQIDTISGVLAAQSQGPIGYVKVILKREAWAKSHRPVGTLFRSDRAPVVGGGDLGVMIVEGSPSGLAQVKAEIAKAETQTQMRFDESKGKEVPYPSAQKSETGAIERIELYGPSDKRRFSVEKAVAWLSNPMTAADTRWSCSMFCRHGPNGIVSMLRIVVWSSPSSLASMLSATACRSSACRTGSTGSGIGCSLEPGW